MFHPRQLWGSALAGRTAAASAVSLRWSNRLVVPTCALMIAGSVAGTAAAPTQGGPTALLTGTPPASVTTVPGSTPIVPLTYPDATVVPTGTGQARVVARRQLEPVSPIATLLPVLQSAYAVAVAGAPASCRLPVSLLAAIGQVESGSLRGRTLDAQHRVAPPLYGPLLDGHGFAAMNDTDGGTLDGSSRWDRALGPMQFIPQTWRAFGVDGDGDGVRDPQDVEDASAAAALYLCHGGRDLSDSAQLRAAVFSYNHSLAYYRLVRAWMAHFEAVPVGSATATMTAVAPTVGAASAAPVGFTAAGKHHRSRHHGSSARATGSVRAGASGSPAATPAGSVDQPGSGSGSSSGSPTGSPTKPGPSPVSTPSSPDPTTAPPPSPSCEPAPTDTPTPVATATVDPTPTEPATPTPTDVAAPTPTEAPAPEPSGCPAP